MKIGLIARADNTGLGVQTHEFYKHMQPYRTMVVDISKLNGNKQYYERYGENIESNMFIKGFPTPRAIDHFLSELDVVFVAESPYNYYLYERARELGVKTAVQYNYEFFDWFAHPDYPKPDMLIAPSMWHFAEVNAWVNHTNQHTGSDIRHIYLHCPVNRELLPYREISKAKTFLHIAGKAAAHDRNGTETVIRASKLLKSDAEIIIHFQGEQGIPHQATNTIADYLKLVDTDGDADRIFVQQVDYDNYADAYTQGDVLLLPRRYGGNCLPANEALSCGMPVIMTDISPNFKFLPRHWLVPAKKIDEFTPRTTIDIFEADPVHLARRIDKFANMEEGEMMVQSARASNIADTISWEYLKYKYTDALEELCTP